MQGASIMGFKLKVLINEWFANDMRHPIDLTQASDLEEFESKLFKRGSKQRSILNLLKNPEQSRAPEWIKSEIDIYFVQRLVDILLGKSNEKESKMLLAVAALRPLFKQLSNPSKVTNVSELKIESTELDFLACQSFMNRKHISPTDEGTLAGDMLFFGLTENTLSLTDIKHLEAIAFSTPKEMVKFLGSITDGLIDIDTLDEKKRLFINYCLECVDPATITPPAFESLQQCYPQEMDELVSWLAISPLAKFSKNALQKPLQTYQVDKNISRLATVKRLSALGNEIHTLMPDKLCHPEMMSLFYKDSNQFLKTSYDLHKMKLDEEKDTYSKTQKTPFRLSLLLALLGIGVAVLAHTTLVAANIIFPAVLAIGAIGILSSQYLSLRGYKNDPRSMRTILPTLHMDLSFLTIAALFFYVAQPYSIVAVPAVLAALASIMPLVAQINHQNQVNTHIDHTPLPQTKQISEVIKSSQLTSMFVMNEGENHVYFVKDPIEMTPGATL